MSDTDFGDYKMPTDARDRYDWERAQDTVRQDRKRYYEALEKERQERKESIVMDAINKRGELIVRLVNALAHLRPYTQVAIISSWIPLAQLEEIVEFQERKN